jgi:CCR4-NOT transcriptional regulation complex NOT5 subunit
VLVCWCWCCVGAAGSAGRAKGALKEVEEAYNRGAHVDADASDDSAVSAGDGSGDRHGDSNDDDSGSSSSSSSSSRERRRKKKQREKKHAEKKTAAKRVARSAHAPPPPPPADVASDPFFMGTSAASTDTATTAASDASTGTATAWDQMRRATLPSRKRMREGEDAALRLLHRNDRSKRRKQQQHHQQQTSTDAPALRMPETVQEPMPEDPEEARVWRKRQERVKAAEAARIAATATKVKYDDSSDEESSS